MPELWADLLANATRAMRLNATKSSPSALILNANWDVVGLTQGGVRFMARHARHRHTVIGDNLRRICETSPARVCKLMLEGMQAIERGEEEFVRSLPPREDDHYAQRVTMTELWAHTGRYTLLRGDDLRVRGPAAVPLRKPLASPLRAEDVRTAERERIARELHDGIAQWLVGMRLELAELRTLDSRERIEQLTDQMANQIEHLQQDVRSLIRQLHPPRLERLGLHDAVRALCAEHARYRGANVKLTIYGPDLQHAGEIESTAFRIVQEALTNAQKHAQAAIIRVRVSVRRQMIAVSVADDGVGLPPDLHALGDDQPGGLGIVGMMARVDAVGGRIAIHNRKPHRGTIVTATLPCPPGQSALMTAAAATA